MSQILSQTGTVRRYCTATSDSMDTKDTAYEGFAAAFPDQNEQEFASAYGKEHWDQIKHALAVPYVCL